MVFVLLNCLLLVTTDQIFINFRSLPWDSTPVCYIDSSYFLVWPNRIRQISLVAEKNNREISYGKLFQIGPETLVISYSFVPPDTYFLSFKNRLTDFRVNLVLETERETLKQRLRLYWGERKIVVYRDMRPQMMLVFEGDSLIAEFLVSTGRKGFETALGNYQIFTKHQRAWSKKWQVWMLYWQSFTLSSPRNGLHALEGEGYEKFLGQPASHGCVRVSRKAGKWLWDWTDTGISFIIRSKP